MKPSSFFKLTVLVLIGLAFAVVKAQAQWGGGGEGDTKTTLTIKPDGSAVLTTETTQPRKTMEMQMRMWERYSKQADDAEEETDPAKPAKPETKSFSDDELAKKIREMHEKRFETAGEDDGQKIETLEVTTNSVRMVMGRKFDSLKDLLSQNLWSWGPSILMAESARFAAETNGQLRVEFTPSKGNERYLKSMTRAWKVSKMKFDWKLVLPGKIVSSSLPETRDNATWISLDASKPEAVDGVTKLAGAPIVIVAEAGGIKLDAPLDSKNLVRAARRGVPEQPELPVTDAGPGFAAEPVSVSVTTIHYFPEGEKYLKDQPHQYGMPTTGTVVTAKLFPPRGRTIQSVSGLRVLKAKDDKGRAIAGTGADEGDAEMLAGMMTFNFEGSDRASVPRLNLQMGLPAADAQTIEELEAEGIVFSIGGWKEMTLTNIQADAAKELDLGELLPGAKLIVTKVTAKKPQTSVQAKLVGPAGVDQLDVKIKMNSRSGSSNSSNTRSSTTAGGKTTRSINVSAYEYNRDGSGGGDSSPPTLIVRMPQDPKRERLRFKLATLDLL